MDPLFHHKKRLALSILAIFSLLPQQICVAAEIASATLEVKAAAGAEGCPDAEALRDRTSKLGTPRAPQPGQLLVEVEFRPSASGYQAIVRTSGRKQGTRELTADGPSCEPIAAATAVVLAIVLDLLPAPEAPASHAELSTPRPEAPTPLAERIPTRRAPAPSHFRYVGVGARLIAGYGWLGPAVTESFGGDARLRMGRAELELGGFAGPARGVEYPPGSVDASLAAGHVGLCGYLETRADRVELGACATIFMGRLSASGHGFYQDGQASSLWLAGAIGATLAIPLARHWALRFGLDAVVPVRSYTLEVDRVGEVFHSGALDLALSFGPEFRFR